MGDFNIDLLKDDTSRPVHDYIDFIYSKSVIPTIYKFSWGNGCGMDGLINQFSIIISKKKKKKKKINVYKMKYE